MTPSTNPVFDETYAHYLAQIRLLELPALAERLGAEWDAPALVIDLYGRRYRVSPEGICNEAGEKPGIDTCVILSKYILRCPQTMPRQKEWVSFKDFKDAGPLIHYFAKDVEGALAAHFANKPAALKAAGSAMGAVSPDLDVRYDVTLQLTALPRIPLTVLFNDADDEFSATCKILFQRSCETWLDAECIAMLASRLFRELRRAQAQ